MVQQQKKVYQQIGILWFKQEEILEITQTGLIAIPFQQLKYSPLRGEQILDIQEYKDKYKDFTIIRSFKTAIPPQIVIIKNNHILIIRETSQNKYLYHTEIQENSLPKLKQISKKSKNSIICKDKYQDLFYIFIQQCNNLLIEIYEVNNNNNIVLQQSINLQISEQKINNFLLTCTMYNKDILLCFNNREACIIELRAKKLTIVNMKEIKKLYYYPQIQQSDTVLFMIETYDKELLLFQNKMIELKPLEIEFQILLSNLIQLNQLKIKQMFLLDLIQVLPNLQEFCLWNSNDFEIVKLLIINKITSEIATSSIIYSLKFNPIDVIGIVKYLEYYCFLVQQDFKNLMQQIYQFIPCYNISNVQKNINTIQQYLNYLKCHQVNYKEDKTDSILVWELLCNITDNYKFII